MSVRIQFDNPPGFYTNLDVVSGRVLLSLTNDENISGIFVKLEGESYSLIARPPDPNRRQRREHNAIAKEYHKVLYKVSQVFPPDRPVTTSKGQAYTLGAGLHEYPFRLKIPFNNSCSDLNAQHAGPGTGFGGFGGLAALQQMQYRHVKKTLPPSLTGFPGEAEIRYFVKATVQRPSLFKENRRAALGFRFLPIEPPRPPPSTSEVFAKRPYTFTAGAPVQKSGIFGGKRNQISSTTPPQGEVDARLPSPAIVTCNEPIPLRLLIRNLNESPEQLFLTSLQINLVGTTVIRALDLSRKETKSWALMTLKTLAIPIGKPGDKIRTETIVDKKLWDTVPLPNTVAPTFHTCNITRWYELEVVVVLGYGTPGNIQPQTITLPLRFQIKIYSGVSPPPALVSAMASRPPVPTTLPSASSPPAAQPAYDPAYPPQLTTTTVPEDDVPPSYEDAMADDITPADGPRREYSGITDINAPSMEEKAPQYSPRHGNPGPGGP